MSIFLRIISLELFLHIRIEEYARCLTCNANLEVQLRADIVLVLF